MTRLRADGLLLLTAAIWATGFLAQKSGNESMGPITFVGARFVFSALLILPFVVREARGAPRISRADHLISFAAGLCIFVGSCLQQAAMVTATVTNGGFLTAVFVVLVPFTTWFLTRQPIRAVVLLACAISFAGAGLLSYRGGPEGISRGDFLLLLSVVPWAISVSLTGLFMARTPRPFYLSVMRYGICAVLGMIVGPLIEPATFDGVKAALPAVLYAGIVSGGIGFTLQVIAQRHTPAPEAALIMSLESVFAALLGVWWLGERLTFTGTAGCALILLAVVVVEAGPLVARKRFTGDPDRSRR